jgi:hypothetical protein
MATSDIVARVRAVLYGAGIGEKPVIIEVAADAAETITGGKIVFTVASGQGAKISAGDVLGVYGAASAAVAHVFYVLSVSTDTVTALNTYWGSTASAVDALDDALLEIIPGGGTTEWMIFQQVEAVFDGFLWDQIWAFNTYAVTPDLSNYQVELNAAVESIHQAFQLISGRVVDIGYGMEKNVHTSVSSTGVIAELVAIDGSNVFLTVRERITEASTIDDVMIHMIATGAAALALDGGIANASMEASAKDNQIAVQLSPSRALWNSFGTLRAAIAADLSVEESGFEYDRG